jgi:hypothetical protein
VVGNFRAREPGFALLDVDKCSLQEIHTAHTFLVVPTRSARRRFPFFVCKSLPPPPPLGILPVLLLPRLPKVTITFPFHVSHILLLWFHVLVMPWLLTCAPAFAPPLPLLLFALNLLRRLGAAALSRTVIRFSMNSDLLLLLYGMQTRGIG